MRAGAVEVDRGNLRHHRLEQGLDAVRARAEGFQRFVHIAHGRHAQWLRLHAGQRGQGLQHAGVGRAARGQLAADVRHHMHGVVQQPARLVGGAQRQKLQKQRQIIRQLVADRLKAVGAVFLDQVHHRLATGAVFAVQVLKQVQRVRRLAVKRADVGFLQGNQRGLAAQVGEQRGQLGAQRRFNIGQRAVQLGQRVDQRLFRVVQQQRQHAITQRMGGCRHDIIPRPGARGRGACRERQSAWLFCGQTGFHWSGHPSSRCQR